MSGTDITLAALPQAFFLAVGVPQYMTIDLGGHLGESDMQLEVNWVVRPQVSPYLQVLLHNLNYFKAPQ